MIIGNNNNNGNAFKRIDIANRQKVMNNNFETKWNRIKEEGKQAPIRKSIFVKDLQNQKYANSSDTAGMHDKTLALLSDRLEKGNITIEEFNEKCHNLSKKQD